MGRHYFGHPSFGFFLVKDRFMAACQLRFILRSSGFGPVLAFGFGGTFGFFIPCPYPNSKASSICLAIDAGVLGTIEQ